MPKSCFRSSHSVRSAISMYFPCTERKECRREPRTIKLYERMHYKGCENCKTLCGSFGGFLKARTIIPEEVIPIVSNLSGSKDIRERVSKKELNRRNLRMERNLEMDPNRSGQLKKLAIDANKQVCEDTGIPMDKLTFEDVRRWQENKE